MKTLKLAAALALAAAPAFATSYGDDYATCVAVRIGADSGIEPELAAKVSKATKSYSTFVQAWDNMEGEMDNLDYGVWMVLAASYGMKGHNLDCFGETLKAYKGRG